MGEHGKTDKQIVVKLSHKVAVALENGVEVRRMKMSAGRPSHPTATGHFHITGKKIDAASNIYGHCVKAGKRTPSEKGAKGCAPGAKYVGTPMPFFQRFRDDGEGFHHGNTAQLSHGCIHLERKDAEWLWKWTNVGTPVHVQ